MDKIQMNIELQPFKTPNYVLAKAAPGRRQDGLQEVPKYALKDIDPMVLSNLCDEFRKEIFQKAGRFDPTKVAESLEGK